MRPSPFRRPPDRRRSPGQSLAEFAIVFPVLMLIIGATIQFGIIFWGQNTLSQVVRDTGRWAATQTNCKDSDSIISRANAIAGDSQLIGYNSAWTATNVSVSWPTNTDNTTDQCPPTKNTEVRFVHIAISHNVPIFFPFVPGNGLISASADFRMEPTAP